LIFFCWQLSEKFAEFCGLFRLDLARKKLVKGKYVAKKARDKNPVLEILFGIGGRH